MIARSPSVENETMIARSPSVENETMIAHHAGILNAIAFSPVRTIPGEPIVGGVGLWEAIHGGAAVGLIVTGMHVSGSMGVLMAVADIREI